MGICRSQPSCGTTSAIPGVVCGGENGGVYYCGLVLVETQDTPIDQHSGMDLVHLIWFGDIILYNIIFLLLIESTHLGVFYIQKVTGDSVKHLFQTT